MLCICPCCLNVGCVYETYKKRGNYTCTVHYSGLRVCTGCDSGDVLRAWACLSSSFTQILIFSCLPFPLVLCLPFPPSFFLHTSDSGGTSAPWRWPDPVSWFFNFFFSFLCSVGGSAACRNHRSRTAPLLDNSLKGIYILKLPQSFCPW